MTGDSLQSVLGGPVPPPRIASVTTVAQDRSPEHGIVNSSVWDNTTERAKIANTGFSQGAQTKFRGNALLIPTGRVVPQ